MDYIEILSQLAQIAGTIGGVFYAIEKILKSFLPDDPPATPTPT